MKPKTSYPSITDQFCGAGGSSLGAVAAGGEVVLAVNHSKLAIETHNTNFPKTVHLRAEMVKVDPRNLPSTDILITSPECTNHSQGKGKKRQHQGQLRLFDEGNGLDDDEERSRMTMWDVVRFTEYHLYNIVIVENVVEIRKWWLFDNWLQAMVTLGYEFECVYLNSMFAHPTPQSRDRIYVVFWRKGNRKPDLNIMPPAWCERCACDVNSLQTWKTPTNMAGKYGKNGQYYYSCPRCRKEVTPYYYCAANAIDWSIAGTRIGDRKTPLEAKTLQRIAYGLKKYGHQALVFGTDNGGTTRNVVPTDEAPLYTQPTRQVFALAVPFLTSVNHSSDRARDITQPLPTQMTSTVPALVTPGSFILSYNDREDASSGIDKPMPTVVTNPRFALIQPFIVQYRNNQSAQAISDPFSTFTAHAENHAVVMPFLSSYNGNSVFSPVTDAAGTVTTVDRHALIQPAEELRVEDCHFRMLKAHEVQAAMAFPQDYVLLGNGKQKVKMLGNAVTPPVMKLLVERCMQSLA